MEDVLNTENNDGNCECMIDNISEEVVEKLRELLEKLPKKN